MEQGKLYVKISAIFLFIFSIIYLTLGALLSVAKFEGLAQEYGSDATIVVILAFVVSIYALVSSVVGFYVVRNPKKSVLCTIFGIALIVVCLGSLVYMQLVHNQFEYFDMIGAVCGIFYITGAGKLK